MALALSFSEGESDAFGSKTERPSEYSLISSFRPDSLTSSRDSVSRSTQSASFGCSTDQTLDHDDTIDHHTTVPEFDHHSPQSRRPSFAESFPSSPPPEFAMSTHNAPSPALVSEGQHQIDTEPTIQAQAPSWLRLNKLLQKVFEKQDGVLDNRIAAREQRVGLRHQREALSDLRAELIKQLHTLFAQRGQESVSPIIGLFEQYQYKEDLYQASEDNYHQFEDDLNTKEYRLEKAERKLTEVSGRINTGSAEPTLLAGIEDDHLSDSETSFASIVTPEHPLVSDYLSKIGTARMLRERLWDMHDEQQLILERGTSRERVGLDLDADSLDFLSQFPALEQQTLDKLATVEQEAWKLKELCVAQGLLDQSEPSVTDGTEITLEPIGSLTRDPLSVLWQKETPSFFEGAMELHESVNTTVYINKWLLHQLCNSTIEIRRLQSTPELRALEVDDETFHKLVLDWWSKDDAAEIPVVRPHFEHEASVSPLAYNTPSNQSNWENNKALRNNPGRKRPRSINSEPYRRSARGPGPFHFRHNTHFSV
ncbi:hypothetical protein AJ80_06851 [Polytolypa hystricis UAMH7299]|uniref:Uncharacterized protein n=1 Tax=Polytolypa hystricis (strain UAMH7299) TaxID=1447883 RepID=A0A2B7XT17_POLH7|nr:hypothetical protein AJ80_06851 [Polytolypa hystricis UAMH7299]